MFKIYLKSSKINSQDWLTAYSRIVKIIEKFPLKLVRVKRYSYYEHGLNTIYPDLMDNRGKEDEYISFAGDMMSYTFSTSVTFYKDWEKQKSELYKGEIDPDKPIYWGKLEPYYNSAFQVEANGDYFFNYLDTGSPYRYALIAIAIMLENLLPGRAFFMDIYDAEDIETIKKIKDWLVYVFDEDFEMPVYHNKELMLSYLYDHYADKTDLVARFDWLYPKKVKQNMEFAIKNIGYLPAMKFYAKCLTGYDFTMWGASDLVSAWMAASKNLEQTLELISTAKQILLEDTDNQDNIKRAETYDYVYFLKTLLNQHILLTPEQREIFDNFYTNKKYLETGEENLFETLMRFGGYRVDICPIYATKEQLFEAFMYHDPKNGKKFKELIDKFYKDSIATYEEFVEKFNKLQQQKDLDKQKSDNSENGIYEKDVVQRAKKVLQEIEEFIDANYHSSAHFFLREALSENPFYLSTEETINNFQKQMFGLAKREESVMRYRCKFTKEDLAQSIYAKIKEKELYVFPGFENSLKDLSKSVLCALNLLVKIEITNKAQLYSIGMILTSKKYWKVWETNNRFAFDIFMDKS